ncbi:MAG TPA: peptidylprolyl isomerase [Myxococcales bacterium]|nr:peptidylprolyl isomerase [Myxococcales bacterium]
MKHLLLFLTLSFAARPEIKDRIAAVVNGQPITLSEVAERVQPELARTQPGPAGDVQRKAYLKEALEQIIDEKLVEIEATGLGIEVTEDDITKGVEQLARQNNMDMAQFAQALQAQNISIDSVRDSLRRQQLVLRLLQYKVKPRKVSDEEVQAAYASMQKKADFEVRARDIFIFSPDGLPPAKEAAQKAKAESALERVKKGESFAKVARDLSDGPTAKEGGDLGYFRRGQLVQALEQAAFSLEPGHASGLIRVTGEHGGWHLVFVEDRRPIAQKPLAEVQEEIRNRLANESVMKEREHYLAQLRKTAQIDEKL